jgi:hypothetical protein
VKDFLYSSNPEKINQHGFTGEPSKSG